MSKINLDAIIAQHIWDNYESGLIREYLKQAIHQALVLASEKAKVLDYYDSDGCHKEGKYLLVKQSILDVEKLIV